MAFMGMSWDDIVVVPITTHQSRLFPIFTARGEDGIQQINAQAASAEVMDEAIEEIRSVLREQRPWLAKDEEDDFTIFTMEEMAGILLQVMGIFTIILGAIASISLLVGGIGIMNIMLISVTERTREIGIRKAVGAKQRDILVQFLIEAATLSLAGGGIGIISGWLLSRLISLIDIGGGQTLQTAVSPDIIILAISVSVFIGLVSGIYPAMKAARQNPIDALRYR
jgi:putative ABC transport system permease protein